ncbi:hypothetical protein A8F94_15180 [Bacillus sp. FJAT-27225]|uniref:cyclic-phosphate processing receiver domain-containing protein n=1 Tax=Bacillus sp. FJAT-27225 TaxID=1743144 RepID=UPI00080C27EA|nr:cyclic-phosphate processing receiver domain-containing protein [Bacillus sp. FJAT-27225]OCA84067.1 hypothetical protein A8F94_15180 [Bacillus sp. FJAT-27225]
MEKISVFLDDYRNPPPGYALVKTIDECIYLLLNQEINHLSLDHDLVDKTRNGLLLVKIMVEKGLFAGRITVHSANSVGGKAMYTYLKDAQLHFKMPNKIIVSLKPLPLDFIPSRVLQHYSDTL